MNGSVRGGWAMRERGYGRDRELTARMFFTMFLLGLLYIAFMGLLLVAGIPFIFISGSPWRW